MAGTAVIPLTNTAKNLKDKQDEEKSRNPNPKTVEETDKENKKKENKKEENRRQNVDRSYLMKKGNKFKKLGDADSKGFENPIGKPQLKERTLRKSGGRINLRGGGICKKGMNPKARGRNS
jgi:hypothetical protein